MPSYCGMWIPDWALDRQQRPGVGCGKGRGLTKPALRRGKRKRR